MNRLKGRTREVDSKEMVKSLTAAREDHMKHYMSSDLSSDGPFMDDATNCDPSAENSAFANLQRRLNPEKQALNAEELKLLIENDEVEKVARHLVEEEHSSSTIITLHGRSSSSSRQSSQESSNGQP